MTPFKYGSIVIKGYFCGRDKLIERTGELLESGQNIVLYGERRMGKSSLISESIRKNKKLAGVIIDFLGVKSEEDIYRRIAKKLLEFDSKKTFYEILLKGLSSFKIQTGIDPITQLPNLTLDAQSNQNINAMDSVFKTIIAINKHQKIVVVLDEFQDILKIKNSYEILAKLRGEIQYLSDIPFAYAGSVESDMISIFSDHSSPFFKSAIPIYVDRIDKEVFSNFIKKQFKSGKRKISDMLIEDIFKITNLVSGDVQQLCEAIWSVTSYEGNITKQDVEKGLEIILSQERVIYERIYLELTAFQSRVLLNVAINGGKEIYSNKFLSAGNFTNTSSVKKVFNKLNKSRILYDHNKEQKFINPFFKLWLLRKFG